MNNGNLGNKVVIQGGFARIRHRAQLNPGNSRPLKKTSRPKCRFRLLTQIDKTSKNK